MGEERPRRSYGRKGGYSRSGGGSSGGGGYGRGGGGGSYGRGGGGGGGRGYDRGSDRDRGQDRNSGPAPVEEGQEVDVTIDSVGKRGDGIARINNFVVFVRSEEHTSELQSPCNLVCRLLLEKKKA